MKYAPNGTSFTTPITSKMTVLNTTIPTSNAPNATPFKKDKTLAQRKTECIRVRKKYPDMIPIICER